jgi:CRISPR-associated exonuclease Cas4
MKERLPDYLPLSYLNQFVYCPRRFWLLYCQSEMEVNAPVLEGQIRHQRAHTPGQQTDEEGRVFRSVYVWSDALRLMGVADFIEAKEGNLIPLEHKRGRMGQWLNDHVQLCAQALCLEERTGVVVTIGEIFYWSNRRREKVAIDAELRERTMAVIAATFALLEQVQMPMPLDHAAKCRDCSLEPICMPRETLKLMSGER